MFRNRHHYRWVIAFVVMALFAAVTSVYAVDLPPANWYAVVREVQTDRLHWITASGEQASITRPRMFNEVQGAPNLEVYISPNGRTLVSIAPLNSGLWGIGFYDLATGQWIQTHQTQQNEAPPPNPTADFTTTSSHFATVLRDANTSQWRVIVFEVATGNAVSVLSRGDAGIPDTFYNDPSYFPMILSFDIDEGLGTYVLRLQNMNLTNSVYLYTAAMRWYPLPPPALAANPFAAEEVLFSPLMGIDVFKTTGRAVLATFDSNNGGLGAQPNPYIGERIVIRDPGQPVPTPLVVTNAYTVNNPQWLRGGEWVGYRVQDGVFATHYRVTTLEGGQGLPLGPNISAIAPTPDGFLGIDATNWRMYHATALNFEGSASEFGTTVFQTNSPFYIVYTTPEGASFGLTTLAQPVVQGDLGIAQPNVPNPVPACDGAPAPRLTPNSTARVAFTNGQPLNLRNAPNGDRVGQLPEGTVFAVMNTAPQCANGYLWWNIQLNDASTYWVAEGDNSGYFIEPWQETFGAGDAILVLPTATPTLELVFVPVATLIPLLPQECLNSPVTRLAVGETAHTSNSSGTLAVYDQPNAQFPTYQLPFNHTVSIIGGPQCRDGIRMWQINATLNNSPITGWVSEGFGQMYFLAPGPARAL